MLRDALLWKRMGLCGALLFPEKNVPEEADMEECSEG